MLVVLKAKLKDILNTLAEEYKVYWTKMLSCLPRMSFFRKQRKCIR